MNRSIAILLCALATTFGGAAHAQSYPSKPIRMVVNFPAGGPLDLLARLVAEKLSAALKQPVVVDNRAGAGGNIGADAVAKAAPDGYTVLMSVDSAFTLNPLVYPKMPFDPDKDLKPVAQVGEFQQVLVVPSKVEAKSVAELVALAKKQRLTYASAGSGSPGQLSFEYLLERAGATMDHVPYKGAAPAVTALLGGEVDAGFIVLAGALPNIKAGKLRPLAVSSLARSPALTDVPTIAESGYPGFDATFSFYMMAPAATPDAVVKTLHDQVVQALQAPDVRQKLTELTIEPVVRGPQEAAARIRADRTKWGVIVKKANIKVD